MSAEAILALAVITLAAVLLAGAMAFLFRDLGGMRGALARLEGAVRSLEARSGTAEGSLLRDLGEARRAVAELLAREDERRRREEELRASARRVEAVLAGSHSRGGAGENILLEAFRQFPPAMMETNFRVRGHPVEYALVLADGRRLPIDSKWPATDLLARLEEEKDEARRSELLQELERVVARKAREASQYIDPAITLPWAVAAVPDGVFARCRRAHWEAFRDQVLIVPYSMALPFLLAIHSLHLRSAAGLDREGLMAGLETLNRCLDGLERTLENGLARGATMVTNAYAESRRLAGEMRGALARLSVMPAVDGAVDAGAGPALGAVDPGGAGHAGEPDEAEGGAEGGNPGLTA